MIVFMVIIGFFAVEFIISWLILYLTHIAMVQGEPRKRPIKYISFKEFIKLFYSKKWSWTSDFPTSFFDPNVEAYEKKNYIHAYIIRIDGQLYIFYPLSFVNYFLWSQFISRSLKKEIGYTNFMDTVINFNRG